MPSFKKVKLSDRTSPSLTLGESFGGQAWTPDGRQAIVYSKAGSAPVFHIYRNDDSSPYKIGRFGSPLDMGDGNDVTADHPVIASYFGIFANDPTDIIYSLMDYAMGGSRKIDQVFFDSSGTHVIISSVDGDPNSNTETYDYVCWKTEDGGQSWVKYKEVTNAKVLSCNHSHSNICVATQNDFADEFGRYLYSFTKIFDKDFDNPVDAPITNFNLLTSNTWDSNFMRSSIRYATDTEHIWFVGLTDNGKLAYQDTANNVYLQRDARFWSGDGRIQVAIERDMDIEVYLDGVLVKTFPENPNSRFVLGAISNFDLSKIVGITVNMENNPPTPLLKSISLKNNSIVTTPISNQVTI